ncbi:conjugative transfer protein MobI(A/C) [Hydrogenovibrio marinus]|uniref:Uncharacterized protein n=1 Tax=Hydrogenovibrio marinus TaxID=28885 RepID=A0A066ZML0_HYDMR|nr:conjugative transfer protein MobI(A/C) [Hydrogenovibrio marinus]KDN94712.1 hypothetical protein EI16_12510 [Hydrogenovibrio marinus]
MGVDGFNNQVGNIEILEKWIEEEQRIILKKAQMVNDVFWKHRDQLIENSFEGAEPLLGCRVQVKDGISISWFVWKFYKPRALKGKSRRYNEHIKKPKGEFKYSLSKLYKHANEKQHDTIRYCEDNFAELRDKLERLRKLKIWIVAYKKSEEKTSNKTDDNNDEQESENVEKSNED